MNMPEETKMCLIIILQAVTVWLAKPMGPAKCSYAWRRHRDCQLPCKAAEVTESFRLKKTFKIIKSNHKNPSVKSTETRCLQCFYPCTYPSCFPGRFGGQQAGAQLAATTNHPQHPRTAGFTPAQPPALQTQQLLQACNQKEGKTAKQRGGRCGKIPLEQAGVPEKLCLDLGGWVGCVPGKGRGLPPSSDPRLPPPGPELKNKRFGRKKRRSKTCCCLQPHQLLPLASRQRRPWRVGSLRIGQGGWLVYTNASEEHIRMFHLGTSWAPTLTLATCTSPGAWVRLDNIFSITSAD
nr:uncharacterized protein LOC110357820 isoform X2 [Columba livia]